MKLILIRFSYGFFFSYNAKDLYMYTHIFLVYLGMMFRGVFPSIISPLTSFSSSQIADREQKCHVECKKLKVVYWHSLCLKCYGRQKKKPFTVDGEIRESANKWMNEWKACCSKGGRNFKAVCWHNWLDTCITDVISLYPLYSLLLCS